MTAFVCARCGRHVSNRYEQFRERIEYTRCDGQERRLSRTLRDVCRDCVDEIRADVDQGRIPAEQSSLFDLDNLGWR
jgi:DNA-directed RNA polymerase subunit N (RpoN/RPB10)